MSYEEVYRGIVSLIPIVIAIYAVGHSFISILLFLSKRINKIEDQGE